MMLALAISLAAAAPLSPAPFPARSDDPPIHVWLNQDNYFVRGDRARVHVKAAQDGYVVVLRADADGRVRVLFPLDPSSDDFVRGGDKFEVRGRGDREAFPIDERQGTGVVLAAWSAAPYKFTEFVRGDHWDYRVLAAQQAGQDAEATLVEIAQRMAGDNHFDYDVVNYTVSTQTAYNGGGSYYPSVGLYGGYGWPYRYRYGSAYYDPFFYDPFFYDPFFYDPFFYRPYVYRPFIYTGFTFRYGYPYGRPSLLNRVIRPGWFGGGGLTFKDRVATTSVAPRFRAPQGALFATVAARSRAVTIDARGSGRRVERPVTPRRDFDAGSVERRGRQDRPEIRVPDRHVTPLPPQESRRVERSDSDRGWSRPQSRPESRGSGGGRGAWSGGGGGGGGGGGRVSVPATRGGGGGGGGRSSGSVSRGGAGGGRHGH